MLIISFMPSASSNSLHHLKSLPLKSHHLNLSILNRISPSNLIHHPSSIINHRSESHSSSIFKSTKQNKKDKKRQKRKQKTKSISNLRFHKSLERPERQSTQHQFKKAQKNHNKKHHVKAPLPWRVLRIRCLFSNSSLQIRLFGLISHFAFRFFSISNHISQIKSHLSLFFSLITFFLAHFECQCTKKNNW